MIIKSTPNYTKSYRDNQIIIIPASEQCLLLKPVAVGPIAFRKAIKFTLF